MTENLAAEFIKQTPAILLAIAGLLGTVATLVVTLRTSRKADRIDVKADTIVNKAAEIQTSTNGHLSKVTEDLKVAMETISGLQAHSLSLEKLVKSLAAHQQGAVPMPKVRARK